MERLTYTDGVYQTQTRRISRFARLSPSLAFYGRFFPIIWQASATSKRGLYDGAAWCNSSIRILRALESVGVRAEITGIEHLKQLSGPCVIVGNHMSLLETVVLPVIVRPVCDVTFIVKESLLNYPVFKHVMRATKPIAVTRTNPRQDFKSVLEGGSDRLEQGTSIIVFPQTTRTVSFNPSEFNTMGVKLARRAGVPIVPLALRTDAWGLGKGLKDYGRIDPTKVARFAFGEPLQIQGRGTDEHQAIIDFITSKLEKWSDEPSNG